MLSTMDDGDRTPRDLAALVALLAAERAIVVAFSGGVDSSTVAAMLRAEGMRVSWGGVFGGVLVARCAFDRVFDGMERAVRHGSTFGTNDPDNPSVNLTVVGKIAAPVRWSLDGTPHGETRDWARVRSCDFPTLSRAQLQEFGLPPYDDADCVANGGARDGHTHSAADRGGDAVAGVEPAAGICRVVSRAAQR